MGSMTRSPFGLRLHDAQDVPEIKEFLCQSLMVTVQAKPRPRQQEEISSPGLILMAEVFFCPMIPSPQTWQKEDRDLYRSSTNTNTHFHYCFRTTYIECRQRTETWDFISTPREPFEAAAVYSDGKTPAPSSDGAPLPRIPQSYMLMPSCWSRILFCPWCFWADV